jgi:hypothetical protein
MFRIVVTLAAAAAAAAAVAAAAIPINLPLLSVLQNQSSHRV